ncbi:MAG: FAD-dependent oxidoreductase, partial [Thermoanaerobaculia bacterium]
MRTFDAAVIGAGTFGAWTAWHLRKAGLSVALIDAYGTGNSRSSSGGESRVIRMGYGADEIYTLWALRSLEAWRELSARVDPPLFLRTGVLWMGRAEDPYMEATLAALHRAGVPNESLERNELEKRLPQIALGPIEWGVLEPESGALLARRAVRAVAAEAAALGAERLDAMVEPPSGLGRLESIALSPGGQLSAGAFVFACGAWMGRILPDLLGERIFPTRQEVFYFGPAAGDARFRPPAMPAWLDLTEKWYGIPDLETRGFKLAPDIHGPRFDPDTEERAVTAEGIAAAREYLARRVPLLKDAPLLSSEVCQYENTSSGDFLIDRHPGFENVWLAGGGSGHGFK